MNFLEKIQNQPKDIRKIILWTIVVILGISLFVWWIKSIDLRMRGLQKEKFIEELNLSSSEEKIKEIEKPEIGEKIQELEGLIEELKKSQE